MFVGEDEKASATFQVLEGIVNDDHTWKTARSAVSSSDIK